MGILASQLKSRTLLKEGVGQVFTLPKPQKLHPQPTVAATKAVQFH